MSASGARRRFIDAKTDITTESADFRFWTLKRHSEETFGYHLLNSAKALAAASYSARPENGMPHAGLTTDRHGGLAIDVRLSELSPCITGPERSFTTMIVCAEMLRVCWGGAQGDHRKHEKNYGLASALHRSSTG
jgi:hypothetical protein